MSNTLNGLSDAHVEALALPAATILGYPRLGPARELKRAVESFWRGGIDAEQLELVAKGLREATRVRLAELGLSKSGGAIPETFSFYDQMLDMTEALGAVPERFADVRRDGSALDLYFALARGDSSHQPLEMTKWFDTNYHFSVPEIDERTVFSAYPQRFVAGLVEAREQGFETRPVLVGPVTFLLLAKSAVGAGEGFKPIDRLQDVLAVYASLIAAFAEVGASWVQFDEPALCSDLLGVSRDTIFECVRTAYTMLGECGVRPRILLTTPYGDASKYLAGLSLLPVEAIHADLVRGSLADNLAAFADVLGDKQFVAGVVDGRNIWRTDLNPAFELLCGLRDAGARVSVATANSLQHVPHTVRDEPGLDPELRSWLAFADEKVQQVAFLARGLEEGGSAIAGELAESRAVRERRERAVGVRVAAVRERAAAVSASDGVRAPWRERLLAQKALGIPELATTTIGSFPQTTEIRKARAAFARGEITVESYNEFLRREIAGVVSLQEEIGVDVLVHGEAERNDMVQYFAEHLQGFAVTQNGWVQSYGTRATRPSILWGDVSRPAAMTVAWSSYAQSLTGKHVKGMLTGPVTILAWSFVRDDQPLAQTATQVALALRDEVCDLAAAGIHVVQVDEPALRELLPLEKSFEAEYLEWSVGAFRLATGGADAGTQIHTHLCYSEFGQIIDAVDGLDADVTSIEAARSRMDVVVPLAEHGYARGIGPGVYDIHSPRVPAVEELTELVRLAAANIPGEQLWINPDCGLKTRGYDETVESLKNMVAAARAVRGG